MSHCRARHPVIAALDAAISCRGIFGASPKMTLFELIGQAVFLCINRKKTAMTFVKKYGKIIA
jgi:hypothetical protein